MDKNDFMIDPHFDIRTGVLPEGGIALGALWRGRSFGMSKKKKAFILLLVLVIVAGAVILLFHRDNAEYVDATQKDEVRWAYELLSGALSSSDIMYCDYLAYAKEEIGRAHV